MSVSVRQAFRAESTALGAVLRDLDEPDFDRPTDCPPWTVRDLLAHLGTTVGRLTDMLAVAAPSGPTSSAADYYGPAKFTPEVDTERVDGARRQARVPPSGPALARQVDRTLRAVDARVAVERPERLVRTRHGDVLTLDDFLLTRVVEVGVHGLDLASALGRPPWLTEPAATVIAGLLLGGRPAPPEELGWDRSTLIRRATGRSSVSPAEQTVLDRHGLRWPTFG